jgi:uncharacterized protein YutD
LSKWFWRKCSWTRKRYSSRNKNIINNLRKIVLEYNNNQLNNYGVLSSDNYKIEENNRLQLNLIQHLTDHYTQLIIEIDYASPLLHITVLGFVDSIMVNLSTKYKI